MKTRGQVAQQLKQVKFRHVKREVTRLLRPAGENCVNYHLVHLSQGMVGVCKLDGEICDSRLGDRSSTCGTFALKFPIEEVKASLKEFFDTRDVPKIAVRFPDVAALLWVLDGETEDTPDLVPTFEREIEGVRVSFESNESAEALLTVLRAQSEKSRKLDALCNRFGVNDDPLESTLENRFQEARIREDLLTKRVLTLRRDLERLQKPPAPPAESPSTDSPPVKLSWWRSFWPF